MECLVCFQIDLVCKGDSESDGVKITPRIGYNCHDTMMEEMAELVEACNNGGGSQRQRIAHKSNEYILPFEYI